LAWWIILLRKRLDDNVLFFKRISENVLVQIVWVARSRVYGVGQRLVGIIIMESAEQVCVGAAFHLKVVDSGIWFDTLCCWTIIAFVVEHENFSMHNVIGIGPSYGIFISLLKTEFSWETDTLTNGLAQSYRCFVIDWLPQAFSALGLNRCTCCRVCHTGMMAVKWSCHQPSYSRTITT